MKKTFLILSMALSAFMFSCTRQLDGTDDDDKKPRETCESVITDVSCGDNVTTSSGTNVMKAWIEGDNLKLEVGYSGCNKHTFDLYCDKNQVNPAIYPNQLVAKLADNNGEQFCQAYFTETLCFDISGLKTGKHGTVQIKLQNHDNVSVMYKY